MSEDEQERFLGYSIAVDQLINASDADVLEVFSRLNSYTVPVNPAELRHAKYQGEFKWSVHEMSQHWSVLWETYRVVGARDAVRLLSDSLMAEMFGIVIEGVRDGGQPKISALYDRLDKTYSRGEVEASVDEALSYVTGDLGEVLASTPLSNSPHFLMLFAATAHVLVGIPQGDVDKLPARGKLAPADTVVAKLYDIAEVLRADEPPTPSARSFWTASRSSTQRIASRQTRFPVYVSALQGRSLGL